MHIPPQYPPQVPPVQSNSSSSIPQSSSPSPLPPSPTKHPSLESLQEQRNSLESAPNPPPIPSSTPQQHSPLPKPSQTTPSWDETPHYQQSKRYLSRAFW